MMILFVYDMLVNANFIYIMYVNKGVELAQLGIALEKIWVLLLLLLLCQPSFLYL